MDGQQPRIEEIFSEDLLTDLANISGEHVPAVREISALLTVLTSCESAFEENHRRAFNLFLSKTSVESIGSVSRPVLRDHENQPAAPQPDAANPLIDKAWRLTDRAVVDVPKSYSEGLAAATLYLLLRDASLTFMVSGGGGNQRAIEIPCLLEMIRHSEKQDTKNDSILSEYLALVHVSFHPEFNFPGCVYCRESKKWDLCITVPGHGDVKVSVKSINFGPPRYFSCSKKHRLTIKKEAEERQIKLVNRNDGENILLHNCSCATCMSNPVRKVTKEDSNQPLEGLEGDCTEKFKQVLRSLKFGVVYLVHANLYFELRYALCTFDQQKFRGRRLPLRDLFLKTLLQCARQDGVPVHQKVNGREQIPTLVDRTGR